MNTRGSRAGRLRIAHLRVFKQLSSTCHVSFLAAPDTVHNHKFSLTHFAYPDNASCITHTSCWFRSALWPHRIRFSDSNHIRQHNTAAGRRFHKRIILRRDGNNWQCLSTSCLTPHLLKAICDFLLQLWILYFSAWANLPENPSLHRLARSWCQFITQSNHSEDINDKSADIDCHAVHPPEYWAGGDSKREDLCYTVTTNGASSFGHLEAAGASSSGRRVATEDPSNTSERKVHLQSHTDGEKYIRKLDDLAENLEPQSEKEHEFDNQNFGLYSCSIG